MKVSEIGIRPEKGYQRLYGKIFQSDKKEPFEIYYEYPEEYGSFLLESTEPFVATLLLPCLYSRENLHIEGPISEILLKNLVDIQEIYCQFFDLQPIEITCSGTTKNTKKNAKGVGAFFSLGIDSFYTLLKNRHKLPSRAPEITHLIFMEGLETFLCKATENTKNLVLHVAEQFQLPIICGRSNLRDHFKLDWSHYFGGGLAATALSLAGGLGHILIPSSYPYSKIRPSGSTPLLDHFWQTEQVTIIHDGCEKNRSEKIVYLATKGLISLKYLRPCVENQGDAYNCGNCFKCIQVMIIMKALGVLEKCETYPNSLPKNWETWVGFQYKSLFFRIEENLEAMRKYGTNPKLLKRYEKVASREKIKNAVKTILETSLSARIFFTPFLFLRSLFKGPSFLEIMTKLKKKQNRS